MIFQMIGWFSGVLILLNMKNKIILLFLILLSFFSCYQMTIQDAYNQWIGKTIQFPYNVSFFVKDSTFSVSLKQQALKLLLYTDSSGCVSCKLKLREWQFFNEQLDSLTDERVPTYIVLASTQNRLKKDLLKADYHYPICIDYYDSTNILNDFIKDDRFRCFLLDENNRVVLIGNPIHNSKIKDLYFRTICERLGIEYNQNSDAKMDSKNEINLGSFPKSESKSVQFFIPNNTESEMQIDTVFTSCECTTAKIDKISISPHQNASLSVIYTPDGSGEFFREVYVKVRGDDKLKTFAIRGNVE